jgi:hypothetical protein
MDTPQSPDSLSRTLAAWRVQPSRNPQFRAHVWARIGGAAGAVPWAAYARRHTPALVSAIALAMIAGGFLGREQARTRAAAESARLAAVYVQGLDARAMRMP